VVRGLPCTLGCFVHLVALILLWWGFDLWRGCFSTFDGFLVGSWRLFVGVGCVGGLGWVASVVCGGVVCGIDVL